MAIHHRLQARARLPLLLYQLAKTGQDKFAVLFNLFVGERVKRIEEYSSGSFVGLGGFGKCGLKFCLGHLKKNCEVVYLQAARIGALPKSAPCTPRAGRTPDESSSMRSSSIPKIQPRFRSWHRWNRSIIPGPSRR